MHCIRLFLFLLDFFERKYFFFVGKWLLSASLRVSLVLLLVSDILETVTKESGLCQMSPDLQIKFLRNERSVFIRRAMNGYRNKLC